MDAGLVQAIFADDAKAREWLESHMWPNGPVCPHCGTDREEITTLHGKAHRPGVYLCKACRGQFTVTVKTAFEKSKIPLSKWLKLLFLMADSKKRISAHHVYRALGVSYKSAWFMCHRLREAGLEEIVEVDETTSERAVRIVARARPQHRHDKRNIYRFPPETVAKLLTVPSDMAIKILDSEKRLQRVRV
jgi:transposase-like protein